MWSFGMLSQQGWRRTGAINVLLAGACEVVLFVCFIVSLSKRETLSIGSTNLFEGSCERTSKLNTIIHLSINILSTGILASSNFFMQIATSPSRKEIDQAHSFLRSLQIGLQSPTNIPALSRRKQICWIILLSSSIPIHLFFNSAVYRTAYQTVEWNATVATSQFAYNGVENQTYWLPGASLAVSGTNSPVQQYFEGEEYDHANLSNSKQYVLGFGEPIRGGYWGAGNNDIRRRVAATAKSSAFWIRLTPQECMDQFIPLKYHTAFKDVVIIVRTGEPEAQGWKRTQIFDFTPENNMTDSWNSRVPPEEVNSLWYWTQCSIQDTPRFIYDTNISERFEHSCGRLFGLNTAAPLKAANGSDVTSLAFTHFGVGEITMMEEVSKGYIAHPGARDLQIDHCLAEPAPCQVRVSNVLILCVIVCVLTKVTTCTFILRAVSDVSLVVPGDAIESFISEPDLATEGLGTLTLSEAQDLGCSPRKTYSVPVDPELCLTIRPRRWDVKSHCLHSPVSRGTWIQVYYPIFLAFVVILTATIFSSKNGFQSIGESENYNVFQLDALNMSYLGTLIFVNTPQLILSVLYLTINALHTQLQVEQEWNSYSRQYGPLRVSYPTGKQVSTYRLQLPYGYSIPLIVVSIILHWLLANALFLFIVEGGAGFDEVSLKPNLAETMGVSPEAAIAIGYSGLSLLIFCCLFVVVALSPCFFSYRKLKSDMIVGGTNSLVLSAACHVAQISSAAALRDRNGETAEIHPNLESGSGEDDDNDYKEYLTEVARGNVRWGAMPLPPDLAEKIEIDNDEPVMHLGFGTEDHDIQAPQTGTLYA